MSWQSTPLYIMYCADWKTLSYLFLPNSSGYQWLLPTIMINRMTSFKMADEIPVNLSTWYTYLLTWYTWVIPLRRRAAISTFGCRRLARVLLRLLRAGHSRGHSTNRPPCVKENMLLKISSAANIVSAPLFFSDSWHKIVQRDYGFENYTIRSPVSRLHPDWFTQKYEICIITQREYTNNALLYSSGRLITAPEDL